MKNVQELINEYKELNTQVYEQRKSPEQGEFVARMKEIIEILKPQEITLEYKGVLVIFEPNALISSNAWRGFLLNAWNYNREGSKMPVAKFTAESEYEFHTYSFITHGSNFGFISNQSIDLDENNKTDFAIGRMIDMITVNNHNVTVQ